MFSAWFDASRRTRRVCRRKARPLGSVVAVILVPLMSAPSIAAVIEDPAPGMVVAEAADITRLPGPLQEVALWALDLFIQADLELPPLRYVNHGADRSPCQGRIGLHHKVDGLNVIELCVTHVTGPVEVMMLHETAHAWADHALTQTRRDRFKELRGWTHWRSHDDVAWHENGTEQAAEIIVWGLIDRPLAMVRIEQNTCAELDVGYRVLTGDRPLHGFRDYC